jgi:hypothetical protein
LRVTGRHLRQTAAFSLAAIFFLSVSLLLFWRLVRAFCAVLVLSVPPSWAQTTGVTLPKLRGLYAEAAREEAAAQRMLAIARGYTGADAAIIGYRGAAEAVQARYMWSPLAKLRAVREAQRSFKQAVAAAPLNVEIRFLRFTIESNVPHYLGYSQHVGEDRALIMRAARRYPELGLDPQSLRIIRDFMLLHGNCTPEEAQMLRNVSP